ncbi:unnamed protein product [Ixodes hexagonus]
MLKMTKIRLQMITDMDIVIDATHKYAKANNKYLPDYDETKPSNYLMYFDANNLMGGLYHNHYHMMI